MSQDELITFVKSAMAQFGLDKDYSTLYSENETMENASQ
jgi:hypothetical protein